MHKFSYLTHEQTEQVFTYTYGVVARHLAPRGSIETKIDISHLHDYVENTYHKVILYLHGNTIMGSNYTDFQTNAVPQIVQFAKQLSEQNEVLINKNLHEKQVVKWMN